MVQWMVWKESAAVVALMATLAAAWPVSAQPSSGPAQTQAPAQPTQVKTDGPAGAPAVADEKGPNAGRVSLLLGVDWASAYYFRGIVNEQSGGNNVQPYAELGFTLLDRVGPLTSLVVAPGIWNNWHYGGGTLDPPSDPKFWYEVDLYVQLTATWWEVLSTSVAYTYSISPNRSYTSYADVAVRVRLSDAIWLGPFALNPSIVFDFETKGEALPADGTKGIYMGIGLAPGYTFFEGSSSPLNLSLPLTFGFSVKDYYTVNGQNQTFGYFSAGPVITLPLKFVPAPFGSWALKAGVQFLKLNSNLKFVNGNDGFVPIGSVGLSLIY
jgi:hypothetical protein